MTLDDQIVVESDPSPDDVEGLRSQLSAFNLAASRVNDGRRLAIFVRADDGSLLAGLTGHTWGGCCEIEYLWVQESLRGNRVGTRLMMAAEREARLRGCSQIVLTTFTFQAPAFYERLGFDVVGEIPSYPGQHAWLLMRKPLDDA